jgi:tetratricopeptide (TPR) repeat protein
MENIDYIERHFNNELSAEEKIQFEQKIINDKDFAQEVAFYYSVLQTAKNESAIEKKKRFKEIYGQQNPSSQKTGVIKRMRIYVASAAAILVIVFSWYLFNKPDSPQQLANEYIKQNFQKLNVTMSSKEDSMQIGLRLYNSGKLPGIVSLQLKNYDEALAYFTQIENDPRVSNPAKLYKALTLMERNNADDKEQAKELLQQIIQNNLEGKETAQQWFGKW